MEMDQLPEIRPETESNAKDESICIAQAEMD
jgi:hypothetical protein